MLYICESWFKCPSTTCPHKVEHFHQHNCEHGICSKARELGISSRCIPFLKQSTNTRW